MSSTNENNNDKSTRPSKASNKSGNKSVGSSISNNNKSAPSKDPAKMLLALVRQDTAMARRQHLLLTFLQMGASFSDVKEIYELYPYSLNRDILFEFMVSVCYGRFYCRFNCKKIHVYFQMIQKCSS